MIRAPSSCGAHMSNFRPRAATLRVTAHSSHTHSGTGHSGEPPNTLLLLRFPLPPRKSCQTLRAPGQEARALWEEARGVISTVQLWPGQRHGQGQNRGLSQVSHRNLQLCGRHVHTAVRKCIPEQRRIATCPHKALLCLHCAWAGVPISPDPAESHVHQGQGVPPPDGSQPCPSLHASDGSSAHLLGLILQPEFQAGFFPNS